MGIFSNIVSFGAGYTLGAKTGGAPIQRLRNTIAHGADRSRASRVAAHTVRPRPLSSA